VLRRRSITTLWKQTDNRKQVLKALVGLVSMDA